MVIDQFLWVPAKRDGVASASGMPSPGSGAVGGTSINAIPVRLWSQLSHVHWDADQAMLPVKR